jgi:hypothetical protein
VVDRDVEVHLASVRHGENFADQVAGRVAHQVELDRSVALLVPASAEAEVNDGSQVYPEPDEDEGDQVPR